MDYENLKHNDSEKQSKAAKLKKGMHYKTAKMLSAFISSKNLKESQRLYLKVEKDLLDKIKDKVELTGNELKLLSITQKNTSKMMDKSISSKFESDNANTHRFENMPVFVVPSFNNSVDKPGDESNDKSEGKPDESESS